MDINKKQLDDQISGFQQQNVSSFGQQRKIVDTSKGELLFQARGDETLLQKMARWTKRNDVSEDTLYIPNPRCCKSTLHRRYTRPLLTCKSYPDWYKLQNHLRTP